MSTADLDITSIGVAAGSALVRDLKGSITTWTKDSTATGHFNVANSEVVPGCVVTFADASTATIVGKSGDGTGASSIILSADHATDAALASITGLVYSAPNVEPNSVYANEAVTGSSTAGGFAGGAGATRIATNCSIPAGKRITKVGYYSTATSGNLTFKVAQDNGGGSYTLTNLGTFTKSQSGYQEWTLGTPYQMPSSGTFLLAYYDPNAQANGLTSGSGLQYWRSGDVVGTQSSWSSASETCHITARHDQQFTASGLYVVCTGAAEANTGGWMALSSVAITQTLGSGAVAYHAACFNKGSATEKWWVYLASAWRSIVELTSGTWQYRDASGTLQNATVNTRLGALAQAFAIAQNQMAKAALEAITADQWASVFARGTLDLACGLQANKNNLAQLDKWTATYVQPPVVAYAIGGAGWVPGVSAFGG